MPKTSIDPTQLEKTMHHIHASNCMIMCLVFVSGIRDKGLSLLSITSS